MSKVVLVTGAGSGIGRKIAEQLAERGYKIVAVGRRQEPLEKFDHPISLDLSDQSAPEKLFFELQERKISIYGIVNNAAEGLFSPFIKCDCNKVQSQIQVQIQAMLALTQKALPSIVKERGFILNVGSVYSFSPVAGQAVYSASKAFLGSFTLSLAEELREEGVRVSLVCPGITLTEFRKKLGKKQSSNWMSKTPDEVARIALKGLFLGKRVIIPGLVNKLYVFVCKHLPTVLLARFISWIMRCVRRDLN